MNHKKEKPLAVGYVRVSSKDQKDDGLSLEVQEKLCRERAERDGYDLLEILDDGGISGHKAERPGLNHIRNLITTKKIEAVITLASDRMFRNERAHIEFMDLIFENDIRLIYIQQASPENNAHSKMSDRMHANINQYYRDQISDKVKSTLYAKTEAGYFPTIPPAGYVNTDNPDPNVSRVGRKIIVPDPIAAPLITELFRLYATGVYSVYDLADAMSRRGLRSHKGNPLSPSRIYDLLRNRIYLGEVKWGKVHNKNGKH